MLQSEISKNDTKKRETFLMVLVIVVLIKTTIELFFVEVFSGIGETVFWALITLALVMYFFLKKSYIYFGIVLIILLIGLLNI